jgi:predicted transcriptional regulator of viral defense system
MRTIDRYSHLQALGRPVLTTAEAAVAWATSLATAARSLSRLADAGLVTKVRHGIWQVGSGTPEPALLLPVLTSPYPSYISGWSALWRHGMIEQIPRSIFAVSLDRARTVNTGFGTYDLHHIHPALFGGFVDASGLRAGVATAEKALFDTVYLFAARHGSVTLPELELPDGFDASALHHWITQIPSARLRTMTAKNLDRMVGTVAPPNRASVPATTTSPSGSGSPRRSIAIASTVPISIPP